MSNITKKELLSVPCREWDKVIKDACSVYIIPSGRKHGSGYACMDMVAVRYNTGEKIRFGGCCDSIHLIGDGFMIDSEHPSRIVRIWNRSGNGTFQISPDCSDINFIQNNELNPSVYEIYKELNEKRSKEYETE